MIRKVITVNGIVLHVYIDGKLTLASQDYFFSQPLRKVGEIGGTKGQSKLVNYDSNSLFSFEWGMERT